VLVAPVLIVPGDGPGNATAGVAPSGGVATVPSVDALGADAGPAAAGTSQAGAAAVASGTRPHRVPSVNALGAGADPAAAGTSHAAAIHKRAGPHRRLRAKPDRN
jgi:hypothetical protein